MSLYYWMKRKAGRYFGFDAEIGKLASALYERDEQIANMHAEYLEASRTLEAEMATVIPLADLMRVRMNIINRTGEAMYVYGAITAPETDMTTSSITKDTVVTTNMRVGFAFDQYQASVVGRLYHQAAVSMARSAANQAYDCVMTALGHRAERLPYPTRSGVPHDNLD